MFAEPDLAIYFTKQNLEMAFEGVFGQSPSEDWLDELMNEYGVQLGEPNPNRPREGWTIRGSGSKRVLATLWTQRKSRDQC